MADAGGWVPVQDNDFSNFQSTDSFNLNEVTGIDGTCLRYRTLSISALLGFLNICVSRNVAIMTIISLYNQPIFNHINMSFVIEV